jgi:sortase A
LKKVEEKGKSVFVWETADYAAGFHLGSAYPGNVGNTVLSGHHNIKGEVFRYLVSLEPGDEVYLYVGEVEYPYVVVEKFVIPEKYASLEQRRENAKWIGYFPDERLTLVTCWPYISNTHRVIVIAKPPE